MSGDLSVNMPTGGTNHQSNDTADFAVACARAGRRRNTEIGNRSQTATGGSQSAGSSETTTLQPGSSVEDAAETIERQGAELAADPDTNAKNLDQRIARNERWLAKAEAFFSDPGVLSFLTPEQVAQVKVDLASYAAQLTAFKELVAKYRAEGKEPSAEEIRAAFGGMREVRRSLQGMVGAVMDGLTALTQGTLVSAFETNSFLTMTAANQNMAFAAASQQTVLNNMGEAILEESRNSRYVYSQQVETARQHAGRQQTPESRRP